MPLNSVEPRQGLELIGPLLIVGFVNFERLLFVDFAKLEHRPIERLVVEKHLETASLVTLPHQPFVIAAVELLLAFAFAVAVAPVKSTAPVNV